MQTKTALETIIRMAEAGEFGIAEFARKALAEAQAQCRTDGRCQYAIDHGAEGLGHCPEGKCCMVGLDAKGIKRAFED